MSKNIRLATAADAKRCLDIYSPVVLETPSSFEMSVPTLADFTGRIEDTLRRTPWLVCETAGEIAGYAYACKHRERKAYQWAVEVSAYVAPDWRRKGVGRALYEALINCLTDQGFWNAYAGISLPNPASVAFHESLGFTRVAVYKDIGYKLGEWHDVGWWGLRLNDGGIEPPPEPKPVGEVWPDVLKGDA